MTDKEIREMQEGMMKKIKENQKSYVERLQESAKKRKEVAK